MDSGVFLSRKFNIVFWITAPALFLIAFYFIAFGYLRSVQGSLREEKSFVEAMPMISEKVAAAEKTLGRYDFGLSNAEVIEALNSQLKEIARLSDVSINTLNIDRSSQGEIANAANLKIGIEAEADAGSIIRFLDAVQLSGKPFVVDSVTMRTTQAADAKRVYIASFSIYYYNISR